MNKLSFVIAIAAIAAGCSCDKQCKADKDWSKPFVIGVVDRCKDSVTVTSVEHSFIEDIEKSGNIPLVLPRVADTNAVDAMLDRVDMIIFQGSAFSPSTRKPPAGKTIEDLKQWDRDRIAFEKLVTSRAIPRRIPMVGICRGINVINTSLGGTYTTENYADLKRDICHMQNMIKDANDKAKFKYYEPSHEITIDKTSRFYQVTGKEKIRVNSFHRTGPGTVSPHLRVVARAPDGVIEAVEGVDYPAFAFQFHPETMAQHDDFFLNFFRHLPELTGVKK